MGLSVHRQRVVFPSKGACANCANFDPSLRCPQQMRDQLCTSFEIVDAGDVEKIDVEAPFVREALGSAEVKHSSRSIEPVDGVDAEVVEVEEVEVDARN